MKILELTQTETIMLYGFVAATLETMVEQDVKTLSNPTLTLKDMEKIKDKLLLILNQNK